MIFEGIRHVHLLLKTFRHDHSHWSVISLVTVQESELPMDVAVCVGVCVVLNVLASRK